jgi:hypothetical protein
VRKRRERDRAVRVELDERCVSIAGWSCEEVLTRGRGLGGFHVGVHHAVLEVDVVADEVEYPPGGVPAEGVEAADGVGLGQGVDGAVEREVAADGGVVDAVPVDAADRIGEPVA